LYMLGKHVLLPANLKKPCFLMTFPYMHIMYFDHSHLLIPSHSF
jgi:hypothetical protein